MLRQGAHHVNRSSLSGSSACPTSTSPGPMIRTMMARSSGSCPTAFGLRSFGCTSRSVRATFRSPHTITGAPAARNVFREHVEHVEELHLRRKVLAAIRHVDGRDRSAPRRAATIRASGRTADARTRGRSGKLAAHVQSPRNSRLRRANSARTPRSRRARRHLRRRRLDFLEARDVRLLGLEPVLDLGLPFADAVDVPGGDFERHCSVSNGRWRIRTIARSSRPVTD